MSLLIFCPAPSHSPLDQSPLWQQTQWITKRCPLSKTVVRKCSACWTAHPSNWLSSRQAPNAWLVMFPQAFSAQLSPSSSEKIFFRTFITLLTPGGSPPVVLQYFIQVCVATLPHRPASVWPASGARSTATHIWPPSHLHPAATFFSPPCCFGGPFIV